MGVLEGAEGPEADDAVGEFSDGELIDLPQGDDGEEEVIINKANDAILAALENSEATPAVPDVPVICLCAQKGRL